MLLGNRRTNRQEIDKGAFNLILDSRSETDTKMIKFTRLLGAREQKACFLFRATTKTRKNIKVIFTMKSLILAQDER